MLNSLSNDAQAPRLLVVSVHLGVYITRQPRPQEPPSSPRAPTGPPPDGPDWIVQQKEGHILNEGLRALAEKDDLEYCQIGWAGFPVRDGEQDALATKLIIDHNSFPIFLDEQKADEFYHRFCKGVLWPTMNYSLANTRRFEGIERLWETYQSVMEDFADAIAAVYREGDLIWINDFHLICLPVFLRERIPDARIGFYLHSPFPSSELFRQLPIREAILEAVCQADVIGFQTYNYARYFLTSVSLLLDWQYGPTSVTDPLGRAIRVHIGSSGIDSSLVRAKVQSAAVQEQAAVWRANLRKGQDDGLQIVVGRATRLDRHQGMMQKLQAFEHFLEHYPQFHKKVVYVQSVRDSEPVRARLFNDDQDMLTSHLSAQEEAVSEERISLMSRISEMVAHINGHFGTLQWTPVHFHVKRKVPLEQSLALDAIADVIMVSPTRDGLNITAHESVIATEEQAAPLILSEFAGAAACLGGSLIVNPYDKVQMAATLKEALLMPLAQRRKKHAQNLRYVEHNTAEHWARTFVTEVVQACDAEGPVNQPQLPLLRRDVFHGFLRSFSEAKQRLIVLDYDGTLVPLTRDQALPHDAKVRQCLRALASDPRNKVWIVSGRQKQVLQELLGELPIGLSSEHGLYMRQDSASEWEGFAADLDLSWREPVLHLMQDFADRVPGTYVEQKSVNITWHYRQADKAFARWLEKDLVQILHQLADKHPINILMSKMAVEVRPKSIGKGSVCRILLQRLPQTDLVFCVGDDRTDEDMFDVFRAAADRRRTISQSATSPSRDGPAASGPSFPSGLPGLQSYTCVVGTERESRADYYVPKQSDVITLLQRLTAPTASPLRHVESQASLDWSAAQSPATQSPQLRNPSAHRSDPLVS